jgi:hypothetical protein
MKAGGKKRSDDDPVLAPGNGVFVTPEPYEAHLKNHAKDRDVSTGQ